MHVCSLPSADCLLLYLLFCFLNRFPLGVAGSEAPASSDASTAGTEEISTM